MCTVEDFASESKQRPRRNHKRQNATRLNPAHHEIRRRTSTVSLFRTQNIARSHKKTTMAATDNSMAYTEQLLSILLIEKNLSADMRSQLNIYARDVVQQSRASSELLNCYTRMNNSHSIAAYLPFLGQRARDCRRIP